MRELLQPYRGADRLNYLCLIAVEMLGEASLARMPVLLSGFESISATLANDVAQAIQNLRLAGIAPGTLRELSLMVDEYRAHHQRIAAKKARDGGADAGAMAQRFVVEDDFSVRKLWTHIVPADVKEALRNLNAPLPVRARGARPIHDSMLPAQVGEEGGYGGYIAPMGFVPPEPPAYDIGSLGRAPGKVSWADLIAVARRFDEIDVQAGRQAPGDAAWFGRLHDLHGKPTANLLKATESGLEHADGVELHGLKHLIGLPGSGKTTLLYLLAGYMAQKGYRTCFLFPSIEVATGFIETLNRYQVEVGLLSGQAETSRMRHVLNFATSMAGQNLGFGVTRPVAPFFASNCALAGFASDEEQEFPHAKPPCMRVLQSDSPHKRARNHRCALSSVCGYQLAERKLAEVGIWAGHILSLDRRVSMLYSTFDVQHFEFVARTFDLLVVDECDGAQANLDARGTPIMKLVGDSDSLWSTLIRDLHQPAAVGRNALTAQVLETTGRFGRAAERLMGRITHFPSKFKKDYANILHTSLSVISEMFSDNASADSEEALARRQALERVWDAAIKRVAFRHEIPAEDDEDEEAIDLDKLIADASGALGATPEEVTDFHDRLLRAIELWERDGSDQAVQTLAKVLRTVPNLKSPHDDETFFAYCGLLVSVSMVVLQHFGLAPHLRLLNAEGLVSDNVFVSRTSRDQLAVLPESLVGRLSGIRYTVSEEGNVDVAHVSFAGTPRVLPARMVKLGEEQPGGGMAVLLTSATSMLEPSPSFHVARGPDYVLRRPNAGHGWKDSRYHFLPQIDARTNKPLRFSGAGMMQRDSILKSIVDRLLEHGALGHVANAIAENDVVEGVGRKAAFVVNSYEQCEIVYNHIHANHPSWRGRVRYLTQASLHGIVGDHAITAAEVEQLGLDRSWDLLVFPMNAIGRGVNIVYQYGPRVNKAMIGSLFFLTRPHPRAESLQLIQGLVGRASEAFDREVFKTTAEALEAARVARGEAIKMARYVLRTPLIAQRLGHFSEPFVADQMIIILQTIGRAMRGDCPAFVYFVDAAWAPNSALGMADNRQTSMLVMMQSILKSCLEHPDPAKRECYHDLYESFAQPMRNIANLIAGEPS